MLASLIFALVPQLSAPQSFPSIAHTSNGSESDDIQLEIIELIVLIHLLEESLHLFHCEDHALLCRNLHHPLAGRLRV